MSMEGRHTTQQHTSIWKHGTAEIEYLLLNFMEIVLECNCCDTLPSEPSVCHHVLLLLIPQLLQQKFMFGPIKYIYFLLAIGNHFNRKVHDEQTKLMFY